MKFKFMYLFPTKEERLKAMRIEYKIIGILMDISLAIIMFATIIVGIMTEEKVQIPNEKETIGIIKSVNNRKWLIENGYTADFIVEYEVDGNKYFLKETVTRDEEKNSKLKNLRGWEPEDKVKIIYNKKNPAVATIDKKETELYQIVIYIILGIIILVYIDIGIEKLREKMKTKRSEKVEKTIK